MYVCMYVYMYVLGEVVDVEGIITGDCMLEYGTSGNSVVGSRKHICDDGAVYTVMARIANNKINQGYVCMYVE